MQKRTMENKKRKYIKKLIKSANFRKKEGLYVLEGPKMVSEAPINIVEEIFVTRKMLSSSNFDHCRALVKKKGYTLVSDSEMNEISDLISPQGIMALLRTRQNDDINFFLSEERQYSKKLSLGPPLLFLLDTLQDPGNLGTLLRSAESAGMTGVISSVETVDFYSPKVVRASMGSILRLPLFCGDFPEEFILNLSAYFKKDWKDFRVFAATLKGEKSYTDVDFTGASAIILGNESQGIKRQLINIADDEIYIPMSGASESLNAAVAGSVIGFEAKRQRDLRFGLVDSKKDN